jgi:hypothetical protein
VHEIHLVLNPPRSSARLEDLVPDQGQREYHEGVRFSSEMAARLAPVGTGLKVTPVTPEVQSASGVEPTRWIWTVQATSSGRQGLRFTMDAILNVDGERLPPRNFTTFTHQIEVIAVPAPSTGQRIASFLSANALWLLLGLFVLFALGLLWWILTRRGHARNVKAVPPGAILAGGHGTAGGVQKHEVFVSHSSKDRNVAVAICHTLEEQGIRCWMAPRDITPGMAWDEAIIDAIEGCQVMVLVLSGHSNSSGQVTKEVRNAVEAGKTVLPFRTEEIALSKALRYHISAAHWLDAITPPLEEHIHRLAETIHSLIGNTHSAKPPMLEVSRPTGTS